MDVKFSLDNVVNKLNQLKQELKADPSKKKSFTDMLGHDMLGSVGQLGYLSLVVPTTNEQKQLISEMNERIDIYKQNVGFLRNYVTGDVSIDKTSDGTKITVPPLFPEQAAQPHVDDVTYFADKQPFKRAMAFHGGFSEETNKYHKNVDAGLSSVTYISNKLFAPEQDTYRVDIDTHLLVKDMNPQFSAKNIAIGDTMESHTITEDYVGNALFYVLNNTIDHAFDGIEGEKKVHVDGKMNGGNYILTVNDNGNGIDEELFPDPNEIFGYRKSRRVDESDDHGKGLYLVKEFVESHGGTITAKNKPEGGALFTLTIPNQ